MNKRKYDMIRDLWSTERNSTELQHLDDRYLGELKDYLSKIRDLLARTPSDNVLQIELLKEEGVNVEYMVRDLLMMRRNKILASVLNNERPSGSMTLDEEEFFERMRRGMDLHAQFVDAVLTGTPSPTLTKPATEQEAINDDEAGETTREYVLVRFVKAIDEPIMGLDEVVYGPFKKEDVALIPTANAKIWLRDGTVVKVVPSMDDGDE